MLKITDNQIEKIINQCDKLNMNESFTITLNDNRQDFICLEFGHVTILGAEYIIGQAPGGSDCLWFDTLISNKSAYSLLVKFIRSWSKTGYISSIGDIE